MSALLELSEVSRSFGRVQALRGVTTPNEAGEVRGLIGPNGAGKTTLVDAVTGHTPASGSVSFDGVDITRMRPHARARR